MDYGWDKGWRRYGAGLETNNPSPLVKALPGVRVRVRVSKGEISG